MLKYLGSLGIVLLFLYSLDEEYVILEKGFFSWLLSCFLIARCLSEISVGNKSLLLGLSRPFVEAAFFFAINYTSLIGIWSFLLSEMPRVIDDFQKWIGTENRAVYIAVAACSGWAKGACAIFRLGSFSLRLQLYNPAWSESITGMSVQSVTSARSDACLQDNQTQQLDSPRLFILMLAINSNLHHVEKLLKPAMFVFTTLTI